MKRLAGTLLLLAVAAGCEAPLVNETVATKLGGASADDQISFWHTLNDQTLTSNDDAMHGLLLFFDNADAATDYEGRVKAMKSRGLLPGDFNRPAKEAVQRGIVAYAIVKGVHLRGGWVLTVFGDSPRYAIRELEYKGLFPQSSPQQPLTGAEFVGIIGKIEDYQTGKAGNIPATELPGK